MFRQDKDIRQISKCGVISYHPAKADLLNRGICAKAQRIVDRLFNQRTRNILGPIRVRQKTMNHFKIQTRAIRRDLVTVFADVCLGRHRFPCDVAGFDFAAFFGAGRRFAVTFRVAFLLVAFFLGSDFLPAFGLPALRAGLAAGFETFFLGALAASFFGAFLAGLDEAFMDLSSARIRFGVAVFSLSSRQPWASRTAIMARRISFQVFCFIITALGNMQPSQQI